MTQHRVDLRSENEADRARRTFESAAELDALYSWFRAELDRTEPMFRDERLHHLMDLKACLLELKSRSAA